MALKPRFKMLFQPGQIGQLQLKNRLVMAPMGTHYALSDGSVSSRTIDYLVARARGGVGMIIVEITRVDSKLQGPGAGILRLDNDRFIRGHHMLAEAVHRDGAKIVLQLFEPGRWVFADDVEGTMPVAPSPIPLMFEDPRFPGKVQPWIKPRAMTVEDIQIIVEKFAVAAERARTAGYDGVQIHGAHGYLLAQFLSFFANQRTDSYGGSLENRMRFSREVVQAVKKKAGADFPILFRLSAMETKEGGYTVEDGKAYARMAVAAGVDALDVTMGSREDKDGVTRNVDSQSLPLGWKVDYSEVIKKEVTVPIVSVGPFREPEAAEEALRLGRIDFTSLGRTLLADPNWPRKALSGRVKEIRKCISCNYCGLGFPLNAPIHCAINVTLGREAEFSDIKAAPISKKVMIVGSGPAGMEAARIAALRGHEVSLYEKTGRLGGQLTVASMPPYKERVAWVRDYLSEQMRKLKVDVHLNTEVNSSTVRKARPDVIIVATGAEPWIPPIPGVDSPNVVTDIDVLEGRATVEGKNTVVLGGASAGCEVAEFLADRNNKVTIISRSRPADLARGSNGVNRGNLVLRLREEKVEILFGHDVESISPKAIVVIDKNGEKRKLRADLVVLARGRKPVAGLAEELKGKAGEVYSIGDVVRPRDMASAIYEGFTTAWKIGMLPPVEL